MDNFKTITIISLLSLCLSSFILGGCASQSYNPIELSSEEMTAESETESSSESVAPTSMESTEAITVPDITDSTPAEATDTTIHMCFAGDILLSNHILNAYDSAHGVSGILDDTLLNEGRNADIFMVNEEFPFSLRGTQAEDKQYTFRIDPKRAEIFNELGIDIVTLANNHILDYGPDAMLDSISTLDDLSILHVGAGENISQASKLETIEVKDKTIGFLGASRVMPVWNWAATDTNPGVFSTYDSTDLVKSIKEAESKCDFTVVYVHWGIERNTEPEAYQEELAKAYIDAGADLVIGSHPHVLQPIRYYNGVPIVYSLGNYLFGSSIPSTELLCVDIAEDNSLSVSIIPAKGSAGKTVSSGSKETVTE